MNRKNKVYYKTAKYICDKCDEQENTKYVAYFLEMNAFQILESMFVLFTAWMLGIELFVFLTMIGFFVGRSNHKGYHASSLPMCVLLSTTSLISLGLLGSLLGLFPSFLLGIIFGFALRKRN